MFNLEIGFYICDTSGFLRIMYLIKMAINILRFVIPIIVIVMLGMDLLKNVINPNDKEGMKKIVNRVVAAIIIFLVPTFVNLVVHLIGYLEVASDSDTDYTISRCYTNANMECIQKIDDYLNCTDASDNEKADCQKYRKCNTYVLSDGCNISTELDNYNCKNLNKDTTYNKFAAGSIQFGITN